MDVKIAKVLDDGGPISVCLKRKRAAQLAASFISIAGKKLATHNKCSPRDLTAEDGCCKRLKLGKCRNNSSKSSVPRKYLNFMRSGLPQRFLLYDNGNWSDIPEELKALARESFEAKKAMTDVVYRGHHLIFDFLRMVQIDLSTGLQLPLAWIDEYDVCFFPELDADACFHGGKEHADSKELNGSREIKVHLEIGISGHNNMELGSKECGPISHYVQLETEPRDATNDNQHGTAGVNKKLLDKKNEHCLKSTVEASDFELTKLVSSGKDYILVQRMFLAGFGPYMDVNNVIGIYGPPLENILVQNRFRLFQKQVADIEKCRGKANVRYGWLACSFEVAKGILTRGIEESEVAKCKEPMYGGGIHLRPSNCSHLSACHSDVDENGLRHMVICRVIMGNVEVVSSGAEQFQPSSENFDSGVDSFQNTKLYIVWNKNVNTHIFPEYVVSFKMSSSSKELSVGDASKSGMSVVTNPTAQLQRTHSHLDSVGSCQQYTSLPKQLEKAVGHDALKNPQQPISPWMPFPILFAAISDKIPRERMHLINRGYSDYQRKNISRVDLIKRLRVIVGDKLLKSTIMSLQYNAPSAARRELIAKAKKWARQRT